MLDRRWRAVLTVLPILAATSAPGGVHQWSRIGPEGGRVSIVRFPPSDPATVHAVVEGTVCRSTDAGATWARRSPISQPGAAIDRTGALASCTSAPGRLACRP
jgi:hypothetical protein